MATTYLGAAENPPEIAWLPGSSDSCYYNTTVIATIMVNMFEFNAISRLVTWHSRQVFAVVDLWEGGKWCKCPEYWPGEVAVMLAAHRCRE